MRCFVGIPLDSEVREALVSACAAVRSADSHWRGEKWVAAENLHLTLVFLGEIPAETVPALSEAVGAGVAGARAFELPFAGLRPVPNARRANMLWAAFDDPDGACAELAAAVSEAAVPFGVEPDQRSFKAHVTLVRTRRPRHAGDRVLTAMASAEAQVPAFVSVPSATLFASTLSKAGPTYTTLANWELLA